MSRPRQSTLNLTPLLDVIFMILLFYMASLVGRSKEETKQLASKEVGLAAEEDRLRDMYQADRKIRTEAQEELALERSERRQLAQDVGALKGELERLAKEAGAKEELLQEIERRFGSEEKVRETAMLLSAIERNFDIYEATFYASGKVRIATPKKELVERTIAGPEDIARAFDHVLPAAFDPQRAVFIVKAEETLLISDLLAFLRTKKKEWIMTLDANDLPILIRENDGQK